MATVTAYEKLTTEERRKRYFSEEFKREKIKELDKNLLTVTELCREYQVSRSAVYKWIYKYSGMKHKEYRQIVEPQSATRKVLLLKEEIKELQRAVGEKQLKIDFMAKIIDLAEEEYGVDIKKKFIDKDSAGTGSTDRNKK